MIQADLLMKFLLQIMTELEKFDKADKYFAKAIEKDPENAIIYVHRALLQLQWTGNIDVVVKYINKALELDEKCELAYESLGSLAVQRYVFDAFILFYFFLNNVQDLYI